MTDRPPTQGGKPGAASGRRGGAPGGKPAPAAASPNGKAGAAGSGRPNPGSNPDRRPRRPPVPGAGGLVFNPRGKVLLIKYPPSRGGAWAFPKGHVEAGETLEETAVREVQEEGGVNAKIRRLLGETRYSNSRGVRRTITWFEMRTAELRAVPEPGFRAVFLPTDEALRRLTHAPDRETLQRAVQSGDLPRRGHGPDEPAAAGAAAPPSRTVTTPPEEVP